MKLIKEWRDKATEATQQEKAYVAENDYKEAILELNKALIYSKCASQLEQELRGQLNE